MAGKFRCILLLIVGLFFSSLSYAKNTEMPSYEEGISLFDVEATLQPDGVLDIKENIHFQARNQQIKHGFYRDLPRLWMQPDGDAALLNYHIVGVTRDGIPEPWHLDWHIGLMSIVVGDKQRFLPQGDYHYQIHYQVKNAFLREGDSDLLIWNVTGNHWPFEIYKTRFSLKFPDIAGNPFSEIDLFTGEEGDTYRNGRILEDGRIESSDPFYREDFTVLYRWPHSLLSNAPAPQTTNIFSHLLLPSTSSLLIWFPCLFLVCGWLYLWKRRPQFTSVDVLRMQKFYLPRKKSSFYRPDTFLQWGGLAILAVILYGNLSPVGWAGMSLVGDMFIMICWLLPFLFCFLELLFARDDDKPCVNRVIITLFLPLICSGVAFYSLYINVGDVFFYWYMPAGYFSAVFLTGYLTGMGYIFLPKFTQTGQQRYAHGEAIVNYLARKEAATHSGRRRKGETRKLDYALLGWAVSANLGREWVARITPSLTAAVRAPEIARSGVLFSLQMHLSLGANTSLLGRSYSGGAAGGGGGGGW
ncbi:DUF2207 domain-containing protein [Escherichia coli]|nr:DUF2207 domain-containing protein [Escherichia coli]